MKKSGFISLCIWGIMTCFALSAKAQETTEQLVDRVLNTLASDEMQGRHTFSPYISMAADFISSEFSKIGLIPFAETNYRQTFELTSVKPTNETYIRIDGKSVDTDQFLIVSQDSAFSFTEVDNIQVLKIEKKDDFSDKFREIVRTNTNPALILVDPIHVNYIRRFNKIYGKEILSTKNGITTAGSKVFVLAKELPSSYEVSISNNYKSIPLFNVVGMLPGKSKPDEYVIFSAHYDHIGILDPVEQDSIANGADDDASGTTAVIALAKYFKNLNQNERTLLFVAFTGEEIGMYGSKYFSESIDPDKVVAMINIEMIGKDSKFGPNTLYITGYDRSDLGSLMQSNVQDSKFEFHPDPYSSQNLFYRSDNATLAALGVPAHTFSTSQIDKDQYYHTVKDEVSTLNIKNIVSSIEAISRGSIGLIDGSQTPTRVEKLK